MYMATTITYSPMAYVQLHGADRDRKEQVMLINDVIIDLLDIQ